MSHLAIFGVFLAVVSGQKGNWSFALQPTPLLVGTPAENLTMHWDVCRNGNNAPEIQFYLQQNSPHGYIGIAFKNASNLTSNGGHQDRDAVYATYTTYGGFSIWDVFAPFTGSFAKPQYGINTQPDTNLGGTPDLTCTSGGQQNGHMFMTFRRKFDTGDRMTDAVIPQGVAHIQVAFDPSDNLIKDFSDWNNYTVLHCGDCTKGSPTLAYPECANFATSVGRPATCPTQFRRHADLPFTFLPVGYNIASLPLCSCNYTMTPTGQPTPSPPTAPTAAAPTESAGATQPSVLFAVVFSLWSLL